MNLSNLKLFFWLFIVFAYISIGVLGLFEFNHMSEAPMANCPYADNGSSLCENSLDHINNWKQFSNATFPSLLLLSFLTILGLVLYFFGQKNFLNQKQYFYKWKYYLYNKKLFVYPNKIIRWLSLFENSPSFVV